MAIYLNEAEYGRDAACIGFPHLVICMGVVAMTGNALFGVHLDKRPNTGVLAQELAAYMAKKHVGGGDIVALYGCCDHKQRYKGVGSSTTFHWESEMKEIAFILGYTLDLAFGFDTSIIRPADGTYLEYHPDFIRGRCHIHYKRNEKVSLTKQTHVGGLKGPVKRFDTYNMRQAPILADIMSAALDPSKSNATSMHEVDYALRLLTVNVARV